MKTVLLAAVAAIALPTLASAGELVYNPSGTGDYLMPAPAASAAAEAPAPVAGPTKTVTFYNPSGTGDVIQTIKVSANSANAKAVAVDEVVLIGTHNSTKLTYNPSGTGDRME